VRFYSLLSALLEHAAALGKSRSGIDFAHTSEAIGLGHFLPGLPVGLPSDSRLSNGGKASRPGSTSHADGRCLGESILWRETPASTARGEQHPRVQPCIAEWVGLERAGRLDGRFRASSRIYYTYRETRRSRTSESLVRTRRSLPVVGLCDELGYLASGKLVLEHCPVHMRGGTINSNGCSHYSP
jgi:hypothetical protein